MRRATALSVMSILSAVFLLSSPVAWAQTDGPAAQGGVAPPDARDPHAWSDGHALGTGKYAVADTRQLRLGDEHHYGSVRVERLERVHTEDGVSTAYDLQARYGRDYDRIALKAEGDYAEGTLHEARTELLWSHAVAGYWDAQLGLRHDSGTGPARTWLAAGIQGLAPYWFEVDATAYVDGDGRTALRLAADYELLLTQRLVLQPRAEAAFYGRSDTAHGLGSGLADAVVGLRLRYELSRRFAPYLGVEWAGKYGETADLARASGAATGEKRWVAGLRFWF